MGLVFRLDEYPAYLERVGAAAYLDVTRRTDPAQVPQVWDNLRAVVEAYGAPWVVQLWTKDAPYAVVVRSENDADGAPVRVTFTVADEANLYTEGAKTVDNRPGK
jgi:hypothetical protein